MHRQAVSITLWTVLGSFPFWWCPKATMASNTDQDLYPASAVWSDIPHSWRLPRASAPHTHPFPGVLFGFPAAPSLVSSSSSQDPPGQRAMFSGKPPLTSMPLKCLCPPFAALCPVATAPTITTAYLHGYCINANPLPPMANSVRSADSQCQRDAWHW